VEALLGWLPVLALGLAGALFGVFARTRGRLIRVLVALSPVALFALGVVLTPQSPPCADLLDGPCETNWVSAAAAIVGFVLFPFSLLAAAAMGIATGLVVVRRRAS
jgi:membrane associated rhomboid family serine protease